MSGKDINGIIRRLEKLEVQARTLSEQIAAEREKLRAAVGAKPKPRATTPDPEELFPIGTLVEFKSTRAVAGGIGQVIGYTKGEDPFILIRRRIGVSDPRWTGNADDIRDKGDIVKRKPTSINRVE